MNDINLDTEFQNPISGTTVLGATRPSVFRFSDSSSKTVQGNAYYIERAKVFSAHRSEMALKAVATIPIPK